jgi:hypothetical protein
MTTKFFVMKDDRGWTVAADAEVLASHQSRADAIAVAAVMTMAVKAVSGQAVLMVENENGDLEPIHPDTVSSSVIGDAGQAWTLLGSAGNQDDPDDIVSLSNGRTILHH